MNDKLGLPRARRILESAATVKCEVGESPLPAYNTKRPLYGLRLVLFLLKALLLIVVSGEMIGR